MSDTCCAPSAPPAEEMLEIATPRRTAHDALDRIPFAIPVDMDGGAPHSRTMRYQPAPPTRAPPPTTTVPIPAPIHHWAVGFWGCCLHKPTFLLAWLLPCLPLATIAQRIGWSSYWRVLLSLLLVFVLETAMRAWADRPAQQFWWIHLISGDERDESTRFTNTTGVWEWEFDTEYDDIHDPFLSQIAAACIDLVLRASLATGVAIAVVTSLLRVRIREQDQLAGTVLRDVLVSCLCNCCAITQMAAHVESSKLVEPVDTLPAYQANTT